MVWGQPKKDDGVVDGWIKNLTNNSPALQTLTILGMRYVSETQFCSIFKALAANTKLTKLYISGHKLGSNALSVLNSSLESNTGLKFISLTKFDEQDILQSYQYYFDGLAKFRNSGLEVDLSNFKLFEIQGVESLVLKLLVENIGISSINFNASSLSTLTLNKIGTAIVDNVNNSNCISLDLSNNEVDDFKPFFENFLNPQFKVNQLLIYEIAQLKEDALINILKSIRGNTNLVNLQISTADISEDKAVEYVEPKTDVLTSFIELFVNDGRDGFINSSLETLILNGISLGKELPVQLNLDTQFSNSSLTQLTLRRINLNDKVFCQLYQLFGKVLPNLKTLDLGKNFLNDSSFQYILESNSLNLEKLVLIGNHINFQSHLLSDTIPSNFVLNSLVSLDLNCNYIESESFSNFLTLLELKKDDKFMYFGDLKLLELANQTSTDETKDKDDVEKAWDKTVEKLLEVRKGLMVVYKLNK